MPVNQDDEAVRAEIQRILVSKTFETSETHRRLLTYLSEKSLAGEPGHLKEYTIGLEVFGKPPHYDPQEDSIVRNQASRLRSKLLEYYRDEGRSDRITVDLPKGGFRLKFQSAAQSPPAATPVPAQQPNSVEANGRKPASPNFVPWMLVAILASTCAVLGYRLFESQRNPEQFAQVPWPLSRIVSGRQPAVIVLDDSKLAVFRYVIGGHPSLQEYLSKDYPRELLPQDSATRESKVLDYLSSSTLVSYADVANVKVLTALAGPLGANLVIRFARDFRPRDLRGGNYVFLGSPIVNPWVTLFDGSLNFKEDDEMVSRGEKYFLNKNPQPGEEARYRWSPTVATSYATIVLLPNETRTGNVLILQGLDQAGTEAVGMVLATAESRGKLRDALLKVTTHPEDVWFEALIRAESITGAPRSTDIIAVRLIK